MARIINGWLRCVDPRLVSARRAALSTAALVAVLLGVAVMVDQTLLRALLVAAAGATAIGIPFYHLLVQQRDAAHELRHLWALSGAMLGGRSWPVPGEWALGADALMFLETEIARRGLRTIVELGPGTSSVILGRRFLGTVDMYGLEHDGAYVERVRDTLSRHGITGYTLIEAPLEHGWYRRSSLLELPDVIDVLLVDGPPNWEGQGRRRPAWPELGDRMAPGGLVLVDDTRRPDERQMALEWSTKDGLSLLYDGGSFIVLEVAS